MRSRRPAPIGRGSDNRDIAADLALGEGTIKSHISTALAKTSLHDRTQLALFAMRPGFAVPPQTST